MSEGEHTIISKIPRERLNQIAGRKLAALAIPVRLAADRETLEGDLAFATRVQHPFTGQRLTRARFAVIGHDHLRFLDPPLAALPAVLFYDVDRSGALEARVAALLEDRAARVQDLAARLRSVGLEVSLDAERLMARAVVKTVAHAFELLAGPEGVRVSRVAPVGGHPFEVPAGAGVVKLDQHASPTDLELWLESAVPEMVAAARREGGRGAPLAGAARLEATAPPRNALTVARLAQAFGEEAVVAPTAPVEVFQEFQWAGTHYRFVAAREVGTLFRGRLIGPSGDVWSDRFDLATFPGTAKVVASALAGLPRAAGDAPPVAPAAEEPGAAAVPPHLLPHAGEVWVMNVVVEQAGEGEVRYVGTDIDGRPYGAARVLKRADFEAVFSGGRGGWRLLILVDQVQDGSVVYRQLDPQRQPMGAPRKMAVSVLVANFVPEAAAF
jgi:hypothetical protein